MDVRCPVLDVRSYTQQKQEVNMTAEVNQGCDFTCLLTNEHECASVQGKHSSIAYIQPTVVTLVYLCTRQESVPTSNRTRRWVCRLLAAIVATDECKTLWGKHRQTALSKTGSQHMFHSIFHSTFWSLHTTNHSKNQIVLANNLVTVVAWLFFPC